MEGITKYQELTKWIENARRIHPEYKAEDLADLAIAAGQDRQSVNVWLTSQRFREAI